MRPTKDQREERERLAELGKKRCSEKSGCGEIKAIDDFGLDKGKWDGKRSICIPCNRSNSNEYNQNNREARREYRRQYYLDNIDSKREYHRTYMKKRRQEGATNGRI